MYSKPLDEMSLVELTDVLEQNKDALMRCDPATGAAASLVLSEIAKRIFGGDPKDNAVRAAFQGVDPAVLNTLHEQGVVIYVGEGPRPGITFTHRPSGSGLNIT